MGRLAAHTRAKALLAVAAALLAGLYPGWKMAATSAAEALREE